MKRIGSFLLVGVALVTAVLLGAGRGGTTPLPFGLDLPWAAAQAASTAEVALGDVTFEGAGTDTTAVVGNGGTVRLSAGYGVQLTGSTPSAPAVVLERRVGSGRWVRTAAPVLAPVGQPLTVVTPAWSTSGTTATVAYRLVSGASTTRAMTVVYENQRRYTGMAARIYRYAARWCPATAVHVAALHGWEAGDYRTGALLIRIDDEVGRTTVPTRRDQRALALHECSHERQWLNYGATAAGRTAMVAAATRYFAVPGIDPVEHAADCGAQALNPGGYLGYGGSCTATQLREGRRLLHGERY